MTETEHASPLPERHSAERVVVLTRANNAPHAGGKAPADVETICRRMGFKCVTLPLVPQERTSPQNVKRFAMGLLRLLMVAARGAPDVLVVQHPIVGKIEKQVILHLFRRSKLIAVIHDLDDVRKPTNHTFADMDFLSRCHVLIAHNDAMKEFLTRNAPRSIVIVLGVFDFLIQSAQFQEAPAAAVPRELFVVGNLHPMKANYLYKLSGLQVPISAFGPNCRTDLLPDGVVWKGMIGPEGALGGEISGFGLVWDGESPDSLEGVWGKYLKYNAPHKLSMYAVLGLPVIVPRKAGMADFVVEQGIGFVVDTIEEASARVSSCSPEEWRSCCDAVRRLRAKLIAGEFTQRALKAAVEAARAAEPLESPRLQGTAGLSV